jgi:molybdopterin/thiamine biosynthesis adenylyltransferase
MRTERYRDLIPPDKLAQTRCTVIGVGSIGRQVALQLAIIGLAMVQLIDHDTVEEVNLGPQGFCPGDIGQAKVDATARMMRQLNPELDVATHRERFARSLGIEPVVFCCVDSIATRRHIWNAVRDTVGLFVDGRMAAEVLRVLVASGAKGREHYPSTMFEQAEALAQPCTARSTIYCANVAAGLMVSQLARWLRGMPPERDVTLNLLSSEIVAA